MFRPELRCVLGVVDSTLYDWIATGIFPAPFSLGPNRSNGCARRNAWIREEVYAWIREQAAKPRTLGPQAKAAQPA
ncbi:Prophage CP4-57 regulatory protein (AlpA) [compost metagenome]